MKIGFIQRVKNLLELSKIAPVHPLSRPSDAAIGAGAFLSPSVQVLGWKQTRIGRNTVLSDDVWINVNFRESAEVAVDIGESCFIGRRNFFTSGKLIRLGDFALTGVDCHFLGAGHLLDPDVPFITTGVTDSGVILIGANCWLGASVTVMKGVSIGFGSVIGARSMVTHDIPPLSLALGSPCRVVKRYDLERKAWIPVAEGENLSVPTEEEYLQSLEKYREKAGAYCRGAGVAGSYIRGDL